MKKAMLKRFILVSFSALILMSLILCISVSNVIVSQRQKDMLYSLELVDYALDYDKPLSGQADNINDLTLTEDTRLTVITTDGEVLTDTEVDAEDLENHADREEFIKAMQNGVGLSKRYSETLEKDMLYVACLSHQGNCVLRIAVPYYGFIHYLYDFIIPILTSLFFALVLALLISRKCANSIAKPLVDISHEILKINDKDAVLDFYKYDWEELNTIVKNTIKLSDDINQTISKLEFERKRIEYILDNMKEGFILLDDNQEVLTINESAREFLGCDETSVGKHLVHYTHNTAMLDAMSDIDNCDDGMSIDINFNGETIVAVYIAKVEKQVLNNNSGIIILMLDVTNERNLVKMRQEFFSNASHELKTPITSIQGYAELLESGIINDESQKKEFLARIKKETKNMTGLINDILTISKLENKQIIQSTELFNVKDIVLEVERSLKPLADKNNIKMILTADDVTVTANQSQMHQLINNLMTNAVIYNKEGGFVNVTLTRNTSSILLIVEDTGIGISTESQARIFERFYRVDKGRSKKSGGTGLGLAIVKHIVQFYKGTINLESKINVGTKITVLLPLFNQD